MRDITECTWPIADLGEALAALSRARGLTAETDDAPSPPSNLAEAGDEQLGRWLAAAAQRMEIEAEPVTVAYTDAEQVVRDAAPALLRIREDNTVRVLALVRSGRRSVVVLTPDRTRRRLPVDAVRGALCRPLEAPVSAEVEGLLETASVPLRRRERAKRAMLRERLRGRHVRGGWLLRLPAGAPFWQQMRSAGLTRHLSLFVGAHMLQYVLWLSSWAIVGRGALQGRLDRGWLVAWVLLLATLVPLRALVTWAQSRLSIGAGALLKRRLLHGALRLTPEEVRHKGAGRFLGQVIESAAVERLALDGGFLAILAFVELLLASIVLAAGAGGALHVLVLFAWILLTGAVSWLYYRRRQQWTEARLEMTHELVERMVGHRTRLAQESPDRWHNDEDRDLAQYLSQSHAMDRSTAVLSMLASRGWLVAGLLGLAPAFVAGQTSTARLAIGLGGVILALRAFRRLDLGLRHLVGAAVAWERIAPLFHAAARQQLTGRPGFAVSSPDADGQTPLVDAKDLVFRYSGAREPVLRGCDLRIADGERVLLEGPSGGGKSTLASLLTGLRAPDSGLLLLHGLDRRTLGTRMWRRRVVSAPQFHENHVLTAPFSFNLLMGRSWPAHADDLREAEDLCRALGLGDLLDRMPSGLSQMVGETGWQLSHGERSRLYIARALLQDADLIVLDESFGALDPETLQQVMRCVLERAPALLVIAHP